MYSTKRLQRSAMQFYCEDRNLEGIQSRRDVCSQDSHKFNCISGYIV
jgi:hypothetical protein